MQVLALADRPAGLPLAVALLEPVDAATDVQDLLLAGVEGVAGEQTSAWIWPSALVLRVVNVFPHVQVTVVSTYLGWMSAFMRALSPHGPPGRPKA